MLFPHFSPNENDLSASFCNRCCCAYHLYASYVLCMYLTFFARIASVCAENSVQSIKSTYSDPPFRKPILDPKAMYRRKDPAALNGPLDAAVSEQFAESFLSRFLDTKRIEDFVKPIPAGQEVLEVIATVRVSDVEGNLYSRLNEIPWEQGKDEEVLVGLRNKSKTSSAIVFGIISNLSNPRKPSEILQKVSI